MSLGALVARHIIMDCELKYPVRNLITVGAPNMGLSFEENCDYKKPDEEGENVNLRCLVQKMIESYLSFENMYSKLLQQTLAPTNLFRDTKYYDDYLK
jgi:zona occludens toxin (predicted ATPase)